VSFCSVGSGQTKVNPKPAKGTNHFGQSSCVIGGRPVTRDLLSYCLNDCGGGGSGGFGCRWCKEDNEEVLANKITPEINMKKKEGSTH
jgi:hypothetical protein